MPLRGKKPTTIEKRLKALFFGEAGAGKTTAAIQFPRPYLIDTERGAEHDQYTHMLEDQEGAIFQSQDFDEILKEVKALLTEKHEFKTLIIDPVTVVYNSLIESAEKKVGNEFGRHYGEANKQMKHLLNLIMRLDMNVIFTAHAKNEYGGKMEVIGQVADGYKKLPYLFDLMVEIKKEGKKRMGYVRKSRIKGLEEYERFEFSYDEVAKRYGREILEKDAAPQALATEEQVNAIKKLFEILKVDGEYIKKGLDKSESASLEEMPKEKIQAWIDQLKKRIEV